MHGHHKYCGCPKCVRPKGGCYDRRNSLRSVKILIDWKHCWQSSLASNLPRDGNGRDRLGKV